MDVRINEIDTQVELTDPATLLTPAVMAAIVAEVRRQLAEEARVRAGRDADRAAGPAQQQGRGVAPWRR